MAVKMRKLVCKTNPSLALEAPEIGRNIHGLFGCKMSPFSLKFYVKGDICPFNVRITFA